MAESVKIAKEEAARLANAEDNYQSVTTPGNQVQEKPTAQAAI